ncbi:hypothetical protein [Streptomyces sp. MAR4 CNX-425]|uniref:hypothetical protein n=1 Tax=Streptomyces sp. MAR4 CNX-425 TaxID=3406343 RepID=UPI003B5094C7
MRATRAAPPGTTRSPPSTRRPDVTRRPWPTPARWGLAKFWARTAARHGVDVEDGAGMQRFVERVTSGEVPYDRDALDTVMERRASGAALSPATRAEPQLPVVLRRRPTCGRGPPTPYSSPSCAVPPGTGDSVRGLRSSADPEPAGGPDGTEADLRAQGDEAREAVAVALESATPTVRAWRSYGRWLPAPCAPPPRTSAARGGRAREGAVVTVTDRRRPGPGSAAE